jgi:hypothetical protein
MLRDIETLTDESELRFSDQIQTEIEYCGTPLSTFPEHPHHYAVLEVDARYSPKLRLYSIAKGTVGIMKVRKGLYKLPPLVPGDIIRLIDWQKKPAYQYIDGKQSVKPGVFDCWIEGYTKKNNMEDREEQPQ